MAQTMDYSRSGGRPGFTIRNPDGTTKFVSMDELEKQGKKDQFLKDLERNTGKTFQQWEDSWLQRRGQEQLKKDDASLKPKPKPAVPPAEPAKPKPVPPAVPPAPAPKPEKKYQFTVGDKSFDLTKAQINQTYRDPKALGGINAVDFGRAANQAIYQFKKPGPSNLMKRYTQPSVEKEAYDVVLDYLLSEGHAETVEEAHYVMMQMDAEYIQSIVEGFPATGPVRVDPAQKLKLQQDPSGRKYYTGPGGREMSPEDVRKVMGGELMVKKKTNKGNIA